MRQSLWTVLTVFVSIFAAAWLLSRGKTVSIGQDRAAQLAQQRGVTEESAPPTIAPTSQPTIADAGVAQPALVVSAADTISRNPPNGLLFAGRGRFQLYRQGDITWRLDTDTGHACILFATDEQWRQARVFQHGCGTT